MNGKPISEAKDPDLRNADIAMKRAAVRAREIAKETGTLLVVNTGGKTVLISPDDIDDSIDDDPE